MCERFHCLPSQLFEEEAELIRMVRIHQEGTPEPEEPEQE